MGQNSIRCTAPEGGVRLFDKYTDTYRFFVRARLTDNPYLMTKDPGYINRLRFYRRQNSVRRSTATGGCSAVKSSTNGETHTLDLHSVESRKTPVMLFQISNHLIEWQELYRLIGAIRLRHGSGGCCGTGRRLFLYREYTRQKTSIEEWGADVRRISQFELANLGCATLDPSAWEAGRSEDPKHSDPGSDRNQLGTG
jgi:hypothetical protein